MKILIVTIAILITGVIDYMLFAIPSPVNILLYLIKDNNTFYLIIDMMLSNLIFLTAIIILRGIVKGVKKASNR